MLIPTNLKPEKQEISKKSVKTIIIIVFEDIICHWKNKGILFKNPVDKCKNAAYTVNCHMETIQFERRKIMRQINTFNQTAETMKVYREQIFLTEGLDK